METEYFSGHLVSRYVVVVEHDLSVLDYLSDYICCLYGVPGAYGVVTMPFSVREGLYTWNTTYSITLYISTYLLTLVCVVVIVHLCCQQGSTSSLMDMFPLRT